MKKLLHLLSLLSIIVLSTSYNDTHAASNATVTIKNVNIRPTVTPINGYFRWRKNADNFTNGNWISSSVINTNDAVTVLDPINANVIYRIRMGGSFQISLRGDADFTYTGAGSGSGNTGDQEVLINSFTLISSTSQKPSYTAYYREGDARNTSTYPDNDGGWTQVPTTNDGVAPFYITPADLGSTSIVQDGYAFGNVEENNYDMQILPNTFEKGRPANPYFYLGGGYYDKYNPSTITQFSTYTFNVAQSTTRSYASGKGDGSVENITGPVNILRMGAEIETAIRFTNKIKPGTTYTFRLFISVPYSGNGRFNGSTTVSGYTVNLNQDRSDYQASVNPSTPATTSIRGAFKTPAKVLPVTLTSFSAKRQAGIPTLNWTTASEINNKGFYVQRSADNNTFTNVTFVNSKATNGNSSAVLNYSFIDGSAGQGSLYYRLQQVDLDGKTNYSNVVSLDDSGADITVGPNPVTSSLTINNTEAGASYSIFSASGQAMKSGIITSSQYTIYIPYLPSGMYILKIVNKSGKQTNKKFFHN